MLDDALDGFEASYCVAPSASGDHGGPIPNESSTPHGQSHTSLSPHNPHYAQHSPSHMASPADTDAHHMVISAGIEETPPHQYNPPPQRRLGGISQSFMNQRYRRSGNPRYHRFAGTPNYLSYLNISIRTSVNVYEDRSNPAFSNSKWYTPAFLQSKLTSIYSNYITRHVSQVCPAGDPLQPAHSTALKELHPQNSSGNHPRPLARYQLPFAQPPPSQSLFYDKQKRPILELLTRSTGTFNGLSFLVGPHLVSSIFLRLLASRGGNGNHGLVAYGPYTAQDFQSARLIIEHIVGYIHYDDVMALYAVIYNTAGDRDPQSINPQGSTHQVTTTTATTTTTHAPPLPNRDNVSGKDITPAKMDPDPTIEYTAPSHQDHLESFFSKPTSASPLTLTSSLWDILSYHFDLVSTQLSSSDYRDRHRFERIRTVLQQFGLLQHASHSIQFLLQEAAHLRSVARNQRSSQLGSDGSTDDEHHRSGGFSVNPFEDGHSTLSNSTIDSTHNPEAIEQQPISMTGSNNFRVDILDHLEPGAKALHDPYHPDTVPNTFTPRLLSLLATSIRPDLFLITVIRIMITQLTSPQYLLLDLNAIATLPGGLSTEQLQWLLDTLKPLHLNTIIATTQLSESALAVSDNTCLICDDHVIYHGPSTDIPSFFSAIHFPCDETTTLVQHILDFIHISTSPLAHGKKDAHASLSYCLHATSQTPNHQVSPSSSDAGKLGDDTEDGGDNSPLSTQTPASIQRPLSYTHHYSASLLLNSPSTIATTLGPLAPAGSRPERVFDIVDFYKTTPFYHFHRHQQRKILALVTNTAGVTATATATRESGRDGPDTVTSDHVHTTSNAVNRTGHGTTPAPTPAPVVTSTRIQLLSSERKFSLPIYYKSYDRFTSESSSSSISSSMASLFNPIAPIWKAFYHSNTSFFLKLYSTLLILSVLLGLCAFQLDSHLFYQRSGVIAMTLSTLFLFQFAKISFYSPILNHYYSIRSLTSSIAPMGIIFSILLLSAVYMIPEVLCITMPVYFLSGHTLDPISLFLHLAICWVFAIFVNSLVLFVLFLCTSCQLREIRSTQFHSEPASASPVIPSRWIGPFPSLFSSNTALLWTSITLLMGVGVFTQNHFIILRDYTSQLQWLLWMFPSNWALSSLLYLEFSGDSPHYNQALLNDRVGDFYLSFLHIQMNAPLWTTFTIVLNIFIALVLYFISLKVFETILEPADDHRHIGHNAVVVLLPQYKRNEVNNTTYPPPMLSYLLSVPHLIPSSRSSEPLQSTSSISSLQPSLQSQEDVSTAHSPGSHQPKQAKQPTSPISYAISADGIIRQQHSATTQLLLDSLVSQYGLLRSVMKTEPPLCISIPLPSTVFSSDITSAISAVTQQPKKGVNQGKTPTTTATIGQPAVDGVTSDAPSTTTPVNTKTRADNVQPLLAYANTVHLSISGGVNLVYSPDPHRVEQFFGCVVDAFFTSAPHQYSHLQTPSPDSLHVSHLHLHPNQPWMCTPTINGVSITSIPHRKRQELVYVITPASIEACLPRPGMTLFESLLHVSVQHHPTLPDQGHHQLISDLLHLLDISHLRSVVWSPSIAEILTAPVRSSPYTSQTLFSSLRSPLTKVKIAIASALLHQPAVVLVSPVVLASLASLPTQLTELTAYLYFIGYITNKTFILPTFTLVNETIPYVLTTTILSPVTGDIIYQGRPGKGAQLITSYFNRVDADFDHHLVKYRTNVGIKQDLCASLHQYLLRVLPTLAWGTFERYYHNSRHAASVQSFMLMLTHCNSPSSPVAWFPSSASFPSVMSGGMTKTKAQGHHDSGAAVSIGSHKSPNTTANPVSTSTNKSDHQTVQETSPAKGSTQDCDVDTHQNGSNASMISSLCRDTPPISSFRVFMTDTTYWLTLLTRNNIMNGLIALIVTIILLTLLGALTMQTKSSNHMNSLGHSAVIVVPVIFISFCWGVYFTIQRYYQLHSFTTPFFQQDSLIARGQQRSGSHHYSGAVPSIFYTTTSPFHLSPQHQLASMLAHVTSIGMVSSSHVILSMIPILAFSPIATFSSALLSLLAAVFLHIVILAFFALFSALCYAVTRWSCGSAKQNNRSSRTDTYYKQWLGSTPYPSQLALLLCVFIIGSSVLTTATLYYSSLQSLSKPLYYLLLLSPITHTVDIVTRAVYYSASHAISILGNSQHHAVLIHQYIDSLTDLSFSSSLTLRIVYVFVWVFALFASSYWIPMRSIRKTIM